MSDSDRQAKGRRLPRERKAALAAWRAWWRLHGAG